MDIDYLSNPYKTWSQMAYRFTYVSATTPCKSIKQIMVATVSNHLEILWIHEANHECVWLKSMIQHIHESCGLSFTRLYKNNIVYIVQIKGGSIQGNKTKQISTKFFYTYKLQENGDINVQKIWSCDSLVELFTKALSSITLKRLRYNIRMQKLRDFPLETRKKT